MNENDKGRQQAHVAASEQLASDIVAAVRKTARDFGEREPALSPVIATGFVLAFEKLKAVDPVGVGLASAYLMKVWGR